MFQYDIEKVKPYLQTKDVEQNGKTFLWTYIALSGIFGTLPFLADLIDDADNVKIALAAICCPIAIITILWSLYLILTLKKHQRGYFLYMGVNSILLSLVFFGVAIKFNYVASHKKLSVPFIVITVAGYLLFLFYYNLHVQKCLKSDYFLKSKIIYPGLNNRVIGVGGISIILSHISNRFLSYDANMMIIAICALFLAYVLALGCHNIYKYRLLKYFDIKII
jgi:hypothetical protein